VRNPSEWPREAFIITSGSISEASAPASLDLSTECACRRLRPRPRGTLAFASGLDCSTVAVSTITPGKD